ncbi:MAG: M56 family metallopeptidase [Gemmatimonadaceae bacterium]
MIAAWMVYVTVVTVLTGIFAFAAEWGLRAIRLPARFAWLGAIALVWIFALIAAVNHPASPIASVAVASPGIAPQVTNGLSTSATAPVSWSSHSLFIEPSSPLAKLDVPLITLWALLSSVGILAIFSSAIRVRINRRSWREESVDGLPVYVSHDVGPAVSGVIGYSIVVPRWIFDLPCEQRRFIIAHEREHIRAADPGLLFVAVLAIVAMPWNVALWYVVRRLHMATEIDCDQRVLKMIPEPIAYAHLLLDVGERAINSAIPIAALAERPSLLQTRIEKMTAQHPRSPWTKSALAATAAGVVFFVACQTPRPYSTSSPSERIPQLASELSSLMRSDSLASLSPEQRTRITSQLDSALIESRGNFTLSEPELDSLVKIYYPEVARNRPVAGTLVAFVFDEQDNLIRHTMVAKVGNEHMDPLQKIGQLFPDVRNRHVWTGGIALLRPEKAATGTQGNIIVVYESFRDPNGAYAMKHRNRIRH